MNCRTNKFSGPKSKSYKLPRGRFLDRQDLFKLFRRTVDLWAVQTYRGVIAGQLYGECRSHSRREMHRVAREGMAVVGDASNPHASTVGCSAVNGRKLSA